VLYGAVSLFIVVSRLVRITRLRPALYHDLAKELNFLADCSRIPKARVSPGDPYERTGRTFQRNHLLGHQISDWLSETGARQTEQCPRRMAGPAEGHAIANGHHLLVPILFGMQLDLPGESYHLLPGEYSRPR